jgi:asparagine synthase (glutamine-hydrolysing)
VPGIVGIITRRPRHQVEPELATMTATLKHEDFHVLGSWCDADAGVYVGWCARQGAFDDGNPLVNRRGDVVVIFSGEEFGRGAVSEARGTPTGEAEYLADSAGADTSFPRGLNGRFQGLLLDRRRGVAQLFNDRFGMHRLYYCETDDGFYFAAEAKAILAVRPEAREIDPQGLGELLTCGCTLEGRTLFRNIRILPCAARWSFKDAELVDKAAYFDPSEWEQQERLTAEAYYEELRNNFGPILRPYFSGRQAVAMSLTGGLDTRMIMAWHRAEPGTLPCFTFGGPLREHRDIRVAREVARACGQPHQVIALSPDVLTRFGEFAERSVYVTDGTVSVNLAPDLFVYERARRIAPVRMTGNYGGEILRGVVAFKPVRVLDGLFSPEVTKAIDQSRDTYAASRRAHPVTFAAFRQAPWQHYGVVALEQTQTALRTPFLDNEIVRLAYQAPPSAYYSDTPALRLIQDGTPALRAIPTDRGVTGDGSVVEFFRHRLLELEFKSEYAFDYGMPQWLSRATRMAPSGLERLFLGRHKSYHFRIWYRDQLKQYVRDVLLDPASLQRPHVQRKMVEHVVSRHTAGDRNYTTELHKLLTVELVHRLLLRPAAARATVTVPLTATR